MFMKLEAAALEHVPAPDQVLEELRPALQRIWNAVETAIHRTIDFFTAEGVPVDASLAPNLVRYCANGTSTKTICQRRSSSTSRGKSLAITACW